MFVRECLEHWWQGTDDTGGAFHIEVRSSSASKGVISIADLKGSKCVRSGQWFC